jgi:ABC-type lipoprotein export system ATPase subunit
MFDLTPERTSTVSWGVDLPLEQRPWHVGLVVGPSGCGKSTIARHLWPDALHAATQLTWDQGRSVLDGFPPRMSIRDITALLCSVGFSSPPAWLRPFHVLSTGQQFRVSLARLLAVAATAEGDTPRLVVCDEFTSVVDRTVAQIGSAALAKTVRQRGQRFIAVTCHEDVEDWLQPDWVYRPAEQRFTWRCLQRRPQIELGIVRCQASAWRLFAHHHYLNHALNRSAACFLASWRQTPVAFSAWLPFLGKGPKGKREHRTVTLPDFQGVGIGNALSDTIAALWSALGYRVTSTTTHPAMIGARCRSPAWRLWRKPSFARDVEGNIAHAATRLTVGFRYVGPSLPPTLAANLLGHSCHGKPLS